MRNVMAMKSDAPAKKYILVMPRIDTGGPLGGREMAYMSVDEVRLALDNEGKPFEVAGLIGGEVAVQFPYSVPYTVFRADLVDMVPVLKMAKREKALEASLKKIWEPEPAPVDPRPEPSVGQFL